MDQEKLDYMEKYLKERFEEWLVKDMEKIKNVKLDFTFPYILLVSAGIDFLGMLAKGFSCPSGDRSRYFIQEWMGRINPLYKDERISNIIYKSVRCGASHQGVYKKGVESSSFAYPGSKHLNHIKCLDKQDRIFIHALQFVDDFIEAQKIFRNEYIKLNPETTYDNLQDMLGEDTIDGFQDLINELKSTGKSFDAKEELKKNLKVKYFDEETSKIYKIDEACIPSLAPEPEEVEIYSTTTSQSEEHTITSLPQDEDEKD